MQLGEGDVNRIPFLSTSVKCVYSERGGSPLSGDMGMQREEENSKDGHIKNL